MESQDTLEGFDNFQELMEMMEKEKPKKAKATKRSNTLTLKKLTKKSKKELLTAPFTEEAEKMEIPLLPTPLVENPEKIKDGLSSEAENEPLTPYQKHAAKFQKTSTNSAKPEKEALKTVVPKGI